MNEYVVVNCSLDPDEEAFHVGLGATVDELLAKHGIALGLTDRKEGPTMILVQWADLARQVGIRVCDDHVAGVRFLELILPWEQLVESLARKPDDTLALRRLGLAAPAEFSQPVFDAINNGLRHGDTAVRDAAAMAAGATSWKEWAPVLTELLRALPPGKLKARISEALRRCEGQQ